MLRGCVEQGSPSWYLSRSSSRLESLSESKSGVLQSSARSLIEGYKVAGGEFREAQVTCVMISDRDPRQKNESVHDPFHNN